MEESYPEGKIFVWGDRMVELLPNDYIKDNLPYLFNINDQEEYKDFLDTLSIFCLKHGWGEFLEFLTKEMDLIIHSLEGDSGECSCSRCHALLVASAKDYYYRWALDKKSEKDFDDDRGY